MRIAIVLVVVAGLVVAAGFLLGADGGEEEGGGVTLVDVTRGTIVDQALATGQIRPEQEFQVKSKISGIVRTCFVEVGDRVDEGDPLFEILPDPTPLELTEAERNIQLAEVTYETAKLEFERSKPLLDRGILARSDYDDVQERFEQARIQRELARERMALLREGRIGDAASGGVDSVLRAPAAGTVLERLVNPGDPVVPLTSFQAGTPLLALADMQRLVFQGTVDEIDVGKLAEGLPVRIEIGALPDAAVTGTLTRIAPKGHEEQGATLFDVEAEIEDRGEALLRAGYSANAEIVIREKRDVLLVPERLVLFEGGETFVEVPGPTPESEPEKRAIQIGLSDGLQVEVVSGLAESDRVVQRPPRRIE